MMQKQLFDTSGKQRKTIVFRMNADLYLVIRTLAHTTNKSMNLLLTEIVLNAVGEAGKEVLDLEECEAPSAG